MFAATRFRCGGLVFAAALLCACTAASAWGAVPGGYGVQRVDGGTPVPDRSFGSSLAAVGDLNADGVSDIAVGNPTADTGRGEVLALSGANGAVIWSAPAPTEPSNAGRPPGFGGRVARLGDVAACGQSHPAGVDCGARQNADGIPEILVSALGGNVSDAAPDHGRVYVLDGRTGAVHRRLRLSIEDDDLPPTGNPAEFGFSIASAGDLDADNEPEAVVGVPGYDETFTTFGLDCESSPGAGSGTCEQSGRVYVFPSAQLGGPAPSGSPTSDLFTPSLVLQNPVPQEDSTQQSSRGERFGDTVSAYGAGLLIGAPLVDTSAPDAGLAFLADGSTGSTGRIDPPAPEAGGRFGGGSFTPPPFGNLGGSASPDVLIGAPSTSAGQGGAFLFDGDLGAPANLLSTIGSPAPAADAGFGTAMARIDGDMPAIASPFGARSGTVHIFNPDTTPAQTICDPDRQAGAGFGAAVATLGDTNGDGFDEVAVGSPGYDHAGAQNGGRVYILTSKGPGASAAPTDCVSTDGGTTGDGDGGGTTADDSGAGDGDTGDGDVVIARVLRRLVLTVRPKRARKNRSLRIRGRLTVSGNRRVCQRRQKIALQRRAGGKRGRFQTFEVAVTRASGSFTARAVASRTYTYRARVSQTARCMGAVSKPARVRVRRARAAR